MFCNEFQAILWKSRQVNWKQFLLSFLFRLCPIALYFSVRIYYNTIGNLQVEVPDNFGYKQEQESLYSILGTFNFYYAPTNPFTEKLMQGVQQDIEVPSSALHGFTNPLDLDNGWERNINSEENFLVIIFNGFMGHPELGDLPRSLNYTIRKREYSSHTGNLYDLSIGTGSGLSIYEDFAALQLSINNNYLRLRGGLGRELSISMEEFPYPAYTKNASMIELYLTFFPVFTMICFNFLASSIITDVVEEKRTGVKELMKMMGLKPSLMWSAMYLKSLLGIVLPLMGVVACVKVPFKEGGATALPNCNFLVLFVFLLLYYCACTSLAFALSCLCKKPFIGVIVTMGVSVGTLGVSLSLYHLELLSVPLKYLLALLPNGALVYGYLIINDFEQRKDTGLHLGTLFRVSGAEAGQDYMGVVLLLLIVQSVLYMLLAVYLEAVFPGQFGVPKKWNFFVQSLRNYFYSDCLESSAVEELPLRTADHRVIDMPIAIEIYNLRKQYNNDVVALDNLNLNLPEGKINVLVGKNGAGKSTTLNILTGMTNYNQGFVSILGHDLKQDTKKVTSMIGICPQNDLYYKRLSVANHFRFIAKLKGVSNVEDKVAKVLAKLDLTKHKDKLPEDLSGGMKRKLCFGMAFVANPKVLILDEPTSGLDPVSRRKIWDILLEWRNEDKTRTVILCTHILEEAETLGENIAVLHSGKVLTQGSVDEIRKQYGAGYTLAVDRNGVPSEKIVEIVETSLHGAIKDKHSTDKTLLFTVPHDQQDKFANLLSKFENCQAYATIKRTTLDDLFMTMTRRKMDENSDPTSEWNTFNENEISGTDFESYEPRKLQYSLWSIFKIMWKYQWKVLNKFNFLFLLFASSFLVGFGFYIGNPLSIGHVNDGESSVSLDFSIYGNTTVYYSGQTDSPFMGNLMDKYRQYVIKKGGTPVQVASVQQALMDIGKKNILEYPKHSIVGAEFNESPSGGVELNVLYSEKATHAPPIALNLAYNVLFSLLDNSSDTDAIVATTQPLRSLGYHKNLGDVVGIIIAIFIIAALLVVGNYVAEIPFYNETDGMKHIQKMAGVTEFQYWFCLFVFHYALWILVVFGFLCVYVIFGLMSNPITRSVSEAGSFTLYLLIFGATNVTFIFCISPKFKRISKIGEVNLVTNILAIVLGTTLKFTLLIYDKEQLAAVLDPILNIFPCYWMFFNTKHLFAKAMDNYQWESMGELTKQHTCARNFNPCCPVGSYVNEDACSAHKSFSPAFDTLLLSSIIVVWLCIPLCTPTLRFFKSLFRSRNEDDHVENKLLSAKKLYKVYKSNSALTNVSFDIKSGECTGILGPNGAGKSTTMKLLTGQKYMEEGEAYANGFSIRRNFHEYLQNIGYCAQENTFNGRLTGRQMLQHMAELRNIPADRVQSEVETCLKLIGLEVEMAGRRCSKYSGGNKRKLCFGMAIIGLPSAMVLDEPSTGVDPVSRQLLWRTIRAIKVKDKGVLLSSHIMEECEALCDQLILMKPLSKDRKSENIISTGSVLEVKAKLGRGVIIECVLREGDEVCEIKESFRELFEDAELKESHSCKLTFFVPLKNDFPPSLIYSSMESLKRKFPNSLDSYMVHAPTLDDIILDIKQ